MPSITKVYDQLDLVETSKFPYAKWSFEKFNPIQSRVMDFYDKQCNALIAASTSSGKSLIAEQFLSHEIRVKKGKGIYLVPLRALAQEKIDQWTDKNYHFNDIKISICTGDYRLTKSRMDELNDADLIIMTSELLNHRLRNIKSENSDFLKEVKTIIVDESHLIGSENRGNHLEVGLMKFTEINPTARVVFLSATMPNVDQLAEWLSYSLNKQETYVINSNFRPVPLNVHYETYDDSPKRYDLVEENKVEAALDIIEDYPDDKFIVFAHTKRSGETMKNMLVANGIAAEFHSADLDKDKRVDLERRFRTDKKLRVVVATSTLAAGINMPARRVIILGVHRGLSEVEPQDIKQECGRAGRLGLDSKGDAYILVPDSQEQHYRNKLKNIPPIESQLLEKSGDHYKSLAFHLVSEIHHESIKTNEDIHNWYKRSLAYFQSKDLQDKIVDETVDLLQKRGVIRLEDNIWKTTAIGAISSLFYFPPIDVADLRVNFWDLFNNNYQDDDYRISIALGNMDSQKFMVVSKAEKDEMSVYSNRIKSMAGKYNYPDGAIKAGYCYYCLLNGNNSQFMSPLIRNYQFDFNRLSQVLMAIDGMSAKWGQTGYFQNLEARIQNGVPAHLVNLCKIPNIGKVRAKKLYENNIKNIDDFLNISPIKLQKMLNLKEDIVQKMISDANLLSLS